MACDETELQCAWLAGLGNDSTRRVYRGAIKEFTQFCALVGAAGFGTITRLHIMAWREYLFRRGLGQGTVRQRLAALSSFFEYLYEQKIVAFNPVAGVVRPKTFVSASKARVFDDGGETEAIWRYLSYS